MREDESAVDAANQASEAAAGMEKYIEKAVELTMECGPKLLLAIFVLIIGLLIIKLI